MMAAQKTAAGILLSGLVLTILGHALAPASPSDESSKNGESTEGDTALDFATDVAPILKAKCLRCHGEKERKGELDLRTLATVLKGGESGAVVIPKDPEKSLLLEKVLEG